VEEVPESRERTPPDELVPNRIDELDESFAENLRLGQDLRFVLVCVGGGAARIGHEIVSRHLRYLETVVINCDPRVQDLEEFDRRVCLGAASEHGSETGGSPLVGGHFARAAEPALERIFEGATFVTVVTTLGGGTGTGVLPFVLEAAARRAAVLSVFAVKPFRCEGERRALADRAIARLHFVDAWVEKLQHQLATLTVLDNEGLVHDAEHIPMNRLNRHWADLIATHIEKAFVIPAEAAVEAGRLTAITEAEPLTRPQPITPTLPPPVPQPEPPTPFLPAFFAEGYAYPGGGGLPPNDAELTFEIIESGTRGPELP
jgi:enamine deaminase RidA (YjgF/YER057c/UK114 family)